jgi:hypothetical protein
MTALPRATTTYHRPTPGVAEPVVLPAALTDTEPEWPDPPTDPDEVPWRDFTAAKATANAAGHRKELGDDRIGLEELLASGIVPVGADKDRHEAYYGPGSYERDKDLIVEGTRRAGDAGMGEFFDENGPTIPLDEFRRRVEEGIALPGIEQDEYPFWREVAVELPPPPKSKALNQTYNSMARPLAAAKWAGIQGKTETNPPGTFIKHLNEADRTPPPDLLLNRLDPAKATVLFGPGDIGKGTTACSWIVRMHKLGYRVLIADYESNEEEWARRIYGLGGIDVLNDTIHISPSREWGGAIWDHVDKLQEQVEKEDRTYLVIDSAGMACGGLDPSKPEAAIQYGAAIQQIGIPSLTLAHVTKAHDARYPYGSVYWHNIPRMSWSLMPKSQDKLLVCRKANNYEKPGASTITFEYYNRILGEVNERPAEWTLEERIAEILADGEAKTPTAIAAAISEDAEPGDETKANIVSATLSKGLKRAGMAYKFTATGGGKWALREEPSR